ncbi:cyclodeaminase/cyclohydrolase family protein [Acidaminobacter sp.]|uniref:cyclodeaminase/cyclohydrolase family protein n=1 Tax=Acidaminobacter sp. TaxID=1872102 RepID=UPI0013811C1A|nr:cyclodeaminase/cyclohydrolase family protein [Acidaminobacter sp.]MDK9709843.1 cyclodeaminase/cyclohydrolase family protein [Acidaminobacter sp.]MZQ96628.1 formiminotransferase-cyclodeaminase [Acidaminobacter sp.]
MTQKETFNYKALDLILDTQDVTVGGGSASAISAAMAAGLIGMVARLSTKKDYGLSAEAHLEVAERCDVLAPGLMQGSLDDMAAFAMIKAAFGLPKETDDEKLARAKAINDAAVQAALTPYENAKKALEVLELGRKIKNVSNPAAGSDLLIGLQLSEIGVKGCIMNMEANMPLIKDAGQIEALKNYIIQLNSRL